MDRTGPPFTIPPRPPPPHPTPRGTSNSSPCLSHCSASSCPLLAPSRFQRAPPSQTLWPLPRHERGVMGKPIDATHPCNWAEKKIRNSLFLAWRNENLHAWHVLRPLRTQRSLEYGYMLADIDSVWATHAHSYVNMSLPEPFYLCFCQRRRKIGTICTRGPTR